MSSIPPGNIVGSIAAATVTQKQRADQQDSEEHKQVEQVREQANLSDKEEHQVEDTLETANPKVRRGDQQQTRHRKRPRGQGQYQHPDRQDDQRRPDHIDLEA